MPSVALSGQDTLVINGRSFVDFADGNAAELTFPNEIATVKTGKNGNSIYGFNETGKQSELKIRLLRGSLDDKFLANLLIQQQNNFAGTILMAGTFVKKIGDGAGNIISDTYITSGGVFVKQVEGKMNAEGEAEQSIAIYTIKFTNSPRALT